MKYIYYIYIYLFIYIYLESQAERGAPWQRERSEYSKDRQMYVQTPYAERRYYTVEGEESGIGKEG